MPKHNNVINNNHFRKDWQRFVKTFFDQPAQKKKRYLKRKEKASRMAPRPVGLLRSAVHCPTIRYNMRIRAGKGFTRAELKAVGFSTKTARSFGIAVDLKRKNRSEEGKKRNIERLKAYKKRVVVLTKKKRAAIRKDPSQKTKFSNDKTARAMPGVTVADKKMEVMNIGVVADTPVYATLRYARHQAAMRGPRDKKRRELAAEQ